MAQPEHSSHAGPRSILVVKPSSMGDVVHALPAVRLVHDQWPHAEIRWLVNPEWAPLLAGNPALAGLEIFPRSRFRGPAGWTRALRWGAGLRRLRPDLVVDLQGLLRSALMAKAMRGQWIIGMSDAREGAGLFHDVTVDVSGIEHAVDRYLKVAREITNSAGGTPPGFDLPPGSRPAGLPAGFVPGQAILLHPFSRGAGKSLTPPQVRRLCELLAPRIIALVGRGPAAIPLPPNAIDLVNRTSLDELVWLLRHGAGCISVDSGPMHLAAALETPLVAIHTWSDPRKVGPYQPNALVWKAGRIQRMDRYQPPPARPEAHGIDDAGLAEIASASRTFGR